MCVWGGGLIFGILNGLHIWGHIFGEGDMAYVQRAINGVLRYVHNIYDLSLGCFLDCKQS